MKKSIENFKKGLLKNPMLISQETIKQGKGSFGTVYLGINNKTNEKVGIKTEIQTKKQHLSLLESECQKFEEKNVFR